MADHDQQSDGSTTNDEEETQKREQEQQHLQHVLACLARSLDRFSLKPWLLAKFDPAKASSAGNNSLLAWHMDVACVAAVGLSVCWYPTTEQVKSV
jgi:hypothetical protein